MGIGIGLVSGVACGEILRRLLNRLDYRVTWEGDNGAINERLFALPGPRRWIPICLGVGWALTLGTSQYSTTFLSWWICAGWLCFCAVGLWLAAVDLDVQRLPDVGQLILAATSVIAGVVTFWTEPAVLVAGLVCALTCGLAFFVVHMISRGGLGFGDVKLAMICGWWLGLGSMTMVIAGMIVACLLALGYSVISKVKVFAFGPWLVVGTILAGLVLPPWSHL